MSADLPSEGRSEPITRHGPAAPVSSPSLGRGDLKVSALTSGLRGLTLASKFLLTLALARLFTPAELGLYGIMAAGLSISIVVLGFEFYSFGMRELMGASGDACARMLRDQLVLYFCGYSVLLPLLSVAFMLELLPGSLILWFYLLVVMEHLSHETTRALLALSRPLAANTVLFVRSAAWVYALLAVILLVDDARDLSNVFLAWAIGAAASFAVAAIALRDLAWSSVLAAPIEWPWLARGLRVARPFMVTAISATGLVFLDRFFIQAYHGVSAVGVYTFFAGISTAAHMLVNSGIAMVRLPLIVDAYQRRDLVSYEREMARLMRLTLVATVIVGVIAAIGILPVLNFVDQPIYWDNAPTFFVLLGAALLRCLADVPVYRLYAQRRDVLLLVANLVAFGVIVAGNAALVPEFGIGGAASAAMAGAVTLAVTSTLLPRLMGWLRVGG